MSEVMGKNKKSNKIRILLLSLSILLLGISFMAPQWQEERRARRQEEEKQRFIQLNYGSNLGFRTYGATGEIEFFDVVRWQRESMEELPSKINFVYSEEEARIYKEDPMVLVGWPGVSAEKGVIALHNAIEFYRERFGDLEMPSNLSYPLQISDIVDNWEEVEYLLYRISYGRIREDVEKTFRGLDGSFYP